MQNLKLKCPYVLLHPKPKNVDRKIKRLKRLQGLLLPSSQTLVQIEKLRPRNKKGYAPDLALR